MAQTSAPLSFLQLSSLHPCFILIHGNFCFLSHKPVLGFCQYQEKKTLNTISLNFIFYNVVVSLLPFPLTFQFLGLVFHSTSIYRFSPFSSMLIFQGLKIETFTWLAVAHIHDCKLLFSIGSIKGLTWFQELKCFLLGFGGRHC